MHILLRYTFRLSIVATFLLLAGCKLAKPPAIENVAVPGSFNNAAGSDTTAARAPWNMFFTDAHLVALIEEAIANNPDVNIALQRIEAVRAAMLPRKGALLPSVNAVATRGQRKFGDHTMDGVGNYDTNFSDNIAPDQRIPQHLPDYYVGLQSTWEIDVWKKLRHRKRAGTARWMASEQGRHLAVTTLVAEVASHYYELLSLDNELNIIRENIGLQQKAVEVIVVQKDAGRANALAVQQLRAQLLNTQSLEGMKLQEIVEATNALNTLLGRFPQDIPRGEPILKQPLPPTLATGIPAQMLQLRPDVQQAALELDASAADVHAARAAFFPALTITASVGAQSFDGSYLFSFPGSLAYNFVGGLTAPLFNQNLLKADYRAAIAFQHESFFRYKRTVLNGYREVVNNMNRIENLNTVARFKQEEVETLQNAVATSRDLFNGGYASYLEVVAAQRGVLDAELALAETRKEQFLSTVGLYRALGGGWQ